MVLSYVYAHLCRRVCLKCRVYMPLGASFFEDVPLVEFVYLEFTCMPGESYRRRLRSLLLYLCYVFRVLTDDLWKSRGLHLVRAFGHGPVYIGPCLRV